MADQERIEDLRRRVEMDPASPAFAQLAEEYRRAGRYRDAADVCRAGLARYPNYLSARVTLGRALVELGRFDEAQRELEGVRRRAPENLTAVRGLAELAKKRDRLPTSTDNPESPTTRTVAALERWLAAIHVTRTKRLA